MNRSKLIVVRGGGDLATGVIHRLHSSGFSVVVLEVECPMAIRRQVSFCEAVYEKSVTIEGVEACHAKTIEEIYDLLNSNKVPVYVDPHGFILNRLKPEVVVDAILAKRNLGTNKSMAPLTIALGPGFEAGRDVDVVVETMRGHNLARIIYSGSALPDTKTPGSINGVTKDRVIHAKSEGIVRNIKSIGDVVQKGEPIAFIENGEEKLMVLASISGIIRGLIRDNYIVNQGFKIADIDPRIEELSNCFTISDKARNLGGSVLEIICSHMLRKCI